MLPSTKALLSFAARFLLIFFLLLPLWFIMTPMYNRLLASTANALLRVIEDPHVTTLVGLKQMIVIVRSDAPPTREVKVRGFTGYLTHFNLILMAALVLAPQQVAWRRRAKMLGVALGMLFVIHVVYLLIGVRFFEQPALEALQGPGGRLYVWGLNFYLSVASQLIPIVIWMALYRTVGRIPEQAPTGEEGRSAVRKVK